jgi:GDP-4-dehydro-6-deoxy-D-mannose reductase
LLKALITGVGGFVGGHLAEHLAAVTDWELWGTLIRPDEGDPTALAHVQTRVVDLREPAAVLSLLAEAQPDVLLHLAGLAFVPDAAQDPWAAFEINVRMQLNLLEALVARGEAGRKVRVVTVASQEIYGPAAPLPTAEDAPLAPANAYATSKAAQDLVAAQYVRSHGLDVVRARPFNHIGPRQDSRFVVSSFARQLAEIEAGRREPEVKVGDLSTQRDFTDVRDIVRAYRLLAERGRTGAAYNLGSGVSYPIHDVLYRLMAHLTVNVDVVVDPARLRASDTPRTLCDAGRAHADLGWAPEIAFEQTLSDTLDWWRSQVAGAPSAETLGS